MRHPIQKENLDNKLKEILEKTKKFASEKNSKLYFVYLPEFVRYTSNYDNENYNTVRSIVLSLDIELIDMHKELFIKQENPLTLFPFELPGHYNKIGYKKISKKIFEISNN